MSPTFAIGIPTLNRYDLLEETLNKYAVDFHAVEIHILDNGNQAIQPLKNTIIHQMPENLGVAGSWNFLCRQIFKRHQWAVIINDDVYWGLKTGDVENVLRKWSNANLLVAEQEWCLFAIPKKTFNLVGDFDENFYPAYFEDNDYAYRINLAGGKHESITELNPVVFRKSMTLQKDKSINDRFMENSNYFKKKWGGPPGKEKYYMPFNISVINKFTFYLK